MHPASRFAHRTLLVVALVATLFACGRTPPDPPGPPATGEIRRFGLDAAEAIGAAELVLRYDAAGLAFEALEPRADGLLLRARDDGAGELRVALVGDGEARGTLLAVRFRERGEAAAAAPTLAEGRAVRLDRSVAAGALSVREVGPETGKVRPFAIPAGTCPVARLEPTFADRRLGDVTDDGTLDVVDALAALDLAVGRAAPSDRACYHADLLPALGGDGTGSVGADDVGALLSKIVDPQLPPELHLRPAPSAPLTFLDLVEGRPILAGNLGTQPLALQVRGEAPPGLSVTASPIAGRGVPGQAWAYRVAPGSFGDLVVQGDAASATYRVGNVTVLIAGQSNGQGKGTPLSAAPANAAPERIRQFGNDFRWDDPAVEPLDSGLDQFDRISEDGDSAVSAGVSLGNELHAATGRSVFLIPSAKGATHVNRWRPDYSGREADIAGGESVNLFENALRRARISARERENPRSGQTDGEGGPVLALLWHQGESDSRSDLDRRDFVGATREVLDALGVPLVVVAQLGAHGRDNGVGDQEATEDNLEHQDIAERQRRMEEGAYQGTSALDQTGSGVVSIPPSAGWARARTALVVTNDLPLSDDKHLSAEAQTILGKRVALAIREHLLGEPVDGTGPRLRAVRYDAAARAVRLELDRPVTAPAGSPAYAGFFTVFDGSPSGDIDQDPLGYGGNALPIRAIVRESASVIRIDLDAAPTGGNAPYVRYMPPHFRPVGKTYPDVVRGTDPHGLPLPSFGPLKAE